MTHPFWLLIVAFAAALLPMFIGVASSYLKVSIVLGMLRSGLGSQTVPSGLVVMAISMTLTAFIMGPVFQESFDILYKQNLPALTARPDLSRLSELKVVLDPWRKFMLKHSGERELLAFQNLASETRAGSQTTEHSTNNINTKPSAIEPADATSPAFNILLPAFMVSELKEAFIMAFVLLLPFLVVDLIVSNILVGLGMYMLSPVMISLPLKLILFVTADGWLLLSQGLIRSYENF